MNWNLLLFVVFPYVTFALAVVVTAVRWRRHPFSVSALSSQLLESRRLRWGSISFHWGITLILLGHLAALIIPSGLEAWNGEPLRLYALEATGLGLGLWTLFGAIVLLYRRLLSPRVRAVTSPMDLVVLIVLVAQVGTGIWIAVSHRWGSFWGTGVLVPYFRSLLTFQPQPELLSALPVAIQLHTLGFFVFLAIFPFSRLVHIITVPLGYLTRPWQKVVREHPEPYAYHPAADEPLERVR